MKSLYSLSVLSFFLWLTGCATPDVKEQTGVLVNWQQQQQKISQLRHWAINGRISVQTEQEGGQADYTWQQHNQTDYDIRLQAPMGAGTTLISGREKGVNLKTSSGEELFDTNVDELMLRLNGWPLPVSGLQYWVRGLPAPTSQHEVSQWNKKGLPRVILQDGWRIEFRKYKTVAGNLLPGKLFISRSGGDEEVDVRLIIRQWTLGSELRSARQTNV